MDRRTISAIEKDIAKTTRQLIDKLFTGTIELKEKKEELEKLYQEKQVRLKIEADWQ